MCRVKSGGINRKFHESALSAADQQDWSAIEDHSSEQHSEKKDERNGPVADQRREQPARDGERSHAEDSNSVFPQQKRRQATRTGDDLAEPLRPELQANSCSDTTRTGRFQHVASVAHPPPREIRAPEF